MSETATMKKMNQMTIKDVNFNGDILRAAQDEEGIIWVGVRWVCEALGLTDGQMKNERKKLQEDAVFTEGTKFRPLGNSPTGNTDTLTIQLDYLPLWLAKIHVTPAMKKENPLLADKLIAYQLKAKDVLASAFVHDEMDNFQMINEELTEIKNTQESFYKDMGNLARLIATWMQQDRPSKEKVEDVVVDSEIIQEVSNIDDDRKAWKSSVYDRINKAIRLDKFSSRREGLIYLYNYITKNYGICWSQEAKDYSAEYDRKAPSTIDLVYDNEMYRSIFDSVLNDLCKGEEKTLDDIINPLIEKRGDKSNHGMRTWRQVYDNMETMTKTKWGAVATKYRKKKGHKNITKKELIENSNVLKTRFKTVVKEMLAE